MNYETSNSRRQHPGKGCNLYLISEGELAEQRADFHGMPSENIFIQTVLSFTKGRFSRKMKRTRRKSPLPYLLLNILLSALTTLTVLWLWNRAHQPNVPVETLPSVETSSAPDSTQDNPISNAVQAPPLPAIDQVVIQIQNVFGMGDIDNEVVILQRVGDLNELWLDGWTLEDQDGNVYTFDGLVMNKDSVTQLYTGVGHNTVNKLYWNLGEPIFHAGEEISLKDSLGNERAAYTIPSTP
jgi:hypothetical protein